MSETYIEKNGEGTLSTYNKKTIYNFETQLSKKKYANLVDFNFGEKFFYGKVQRDFVPMYFDNIGIQLKPIVSSQAQGQAFRAINFVADAFDKLSDQFAKAIMDSKIYADEPFLSKLEAFKAFTDPVATYDQHLTTFTEAMAEQLTTDNIQIKNFDDFMTLFKSYAIRSSPEIPFTFSAFLKSKYCPMSVSGLVIEIADLDYYNDHEKIVQFYNSRNWEYYVNACRSYGFMVDKNIPWRLVADIASPAMLSYAAEYGFGKTNLILNSGYARPEMFFLKDFRQYLLNLYNRVIREEHAEAQKCGDSIVVNYFKTETYTLDQVFEMVNDETLVKFYFDIRFAEDPKTFTDEKKDAIVSECVDILSVLGGSKSLRVFEKIINQPFDYRGSMGYAYKQYLKGFGAKVVLSRSG